MFLKNLYLFILTATKLKSLQRLKVGNGLMSSGAAEICKHISESLYHFKMQVHCWLSFSSLSLKIQVNSLNQSKKTVFFKGLFN